MQGGNCAIASSARLNLLPSPTLRRSSPISLLSLSWQVWLETGQDYQLITELQKKPVGEACTKQNTQPSGSPQPKKPGLFTSLQRFCVPSAVDPLLMRCYRIAVSNPQTPGIGAKRKRASLMTGATCITCPFPIRCHQCHPCSCIQILPVQRLNLVILIQPDTTSL